MKKIYLNCLVVLLMLMGTNTLVAQNWGNLGTLLNLLPEESQEVFYEENDGLSNVFQDDGTGLPELDVARDSLFHYFGDGSIGEAGLFMPFLQYNQDQLDNGLSNNIVSLEDSQSMANEFIRVEDIWYAENSNLNTTIGDYQTTLMNLDSIGFVRVDTRWDNNNSAWFEAYEEIDNNNNSSLVPQEGIETAEDLLDNIIFNSIYDFEIAYGQEFSDISFYKESYSARSSMIRVASVPKLNQRVEARWAIEGSFFNAPEDLAENSLLNSEAIVNNYDNVNLEDGLNPFIVNANLAITYLPSLGSVGDGGKFRLYSSIGIEASSYIPSHRTEAVVFRVDHTGRIGKTTGYGPQIGAGFVVNYAGLSFYSYGTVATGIVGLSSDYRYNASTINAGIRFGDAINVRYTLGEASWAPNNDKSAQYSRFTVGIILDELSRP